MSSRNRLYVGRLSSRTRERDLEDAFAKYGKVLTTDLKYGYAFVEFEDSRDADDAVRYLNGHSLDGSRIAVEHSRGGRKSNPRGPPQRSEYRVSIEGLSRDVSWQDLKDKFRKVGDVLFADVFTDRSGKFKGVVEFKARDDLRAAIRDLDDSDFRGSVIRVKEDDRRRTSRSPARRRSRSRSRSPARSSRRSSRKRSPSSSRSPSRRSRSRSPKRSSRRKSHSRSRSPRKASRSRSRSRSPPARESSRKRSSSPAAATKDRKSSRSRSRSASPKHRSSRSPSPHNGNNGNDNHSPAKNNRSPSKSPSKSPERNSDKEGSPVSD